MNSWYLWYFNYAIKSWNNAIYKFYSNIANNKPNVIKMYDPKNYVIMTKNMCLFQSKFGFKFNAAIKQHEKLFFWFSVHVPALLSNTIIIRGNWLKNIKMLFI